MAFSGGAACKASVKPLRTSPSFRSEELAALPLRRVVLVPLEDEAHAGMARIAVQTAVAHEFEKSTSAEIIAIDPMSHMEVAKQDPPRRSGQYQLEAILQLATRHGADAVLFGAITAYRPYSPQHLGIRLDLISAESGMLLWSVYSDFDMADADANHTLERAYLRQASSPASTLSWEQAQNSPARVAALVASEAVATLRKK
jgi:hypothetical protein